MIYYLPKEFHYLLKEIALTELAIAMTTILIDNYGDTTSALVDLRKRINNLSLKFDSISV